MIAWKIFWMDSQDKNTIETIAILPTHKTWELDKRIFSSSSQRSLFFSKLFICNKQCHLLFHQWNCPDLYVFQHWTKSHMMYWWSYAIRSFVTSLYLQEIIQVHLTSQSLQKKGVGGNRNWVDSIGLEYQSDPFCIFLKFWFAGSTFCISEPTHGKYWGHNFNCICICKSTAIRSHCQHVEYHHPWQYAKGVVQICWETGIQKFGENFCWEQFCKLCSLHKCSQCTGRKIEQFLYIFKKRYPKPPFISRPPHHKMFCRVLSYKSEASWAWKMVYFLQIFHADAAAIESVSLSPEHWCCSMEWELWP